MPITIALRIAANMLHCGSDSEPDIGLINHKLAKEINDIDQFVRNADGILRSRQSIAQIIYQWKKENPNEKLYGD